MSTPKRTPEEIRESLISRLMAGNYQNSQGGTSWQFEIDAALREAADAAFPRCPRCGGDGERAYADSATWRGGIGGQTITAAVCDACWGTGRTDVLGPNIRTLEAYVATRCKQAADAALIGRCHCKLEGEPGRETILHECQVHAESRLRYAGRAADARDAEWSNALWPENPEGAEASTPEEAKAYIKAVVAYTDFRARNEEREVLRKELSTYGASVPHRTDWLLAWLDARSRAEEPKP